MPGGETPTSLSYQGNIVQPTELVATNTATAPAAGGTIVTGTPVAGNYTVNWTVGFDSGTPAAGDSNNFGLYQGATLLATSDNPDVVGAYPQSPVAVSLPLGATALAVKAIGVGTAAVVYSATINAVPAVAVSPDDPLFAYNALTANGTSVNITSTPANLATTLAGFDLSAQAECQVGRGSLVPAGTSDFGFVDTTYLPTQAQMLTAPFGQPGSGQYNY